MAKSPVNMKLLSCFPIAIAIAILLLLLLLLLLQLVSAEALTTHIAADSQVEDPAAAAGGLVRKHRHAKINCGEECSRRCSKSSRKKVCHRACKACCAKCHCVPPGTYGNKNLCPCYANLTTHRNRPKCP